jgi:hypothetical protein
MAKFIDEFVDGEYPDDEFVPEPEPEPAPKQEPVPEPPKGPVFDRGDDGKIHDIS